jgi:succinate dehydrogenase/fumarate reductase flavoprotein subunit
VAQQEEVDLLVVGSGCGGMVTALMAAIRGYKVMLVEKTDRIGGTTAYSSGTAWIPGSHLADGRQPADDCADASRYLEWMAQTDVGREQRDAFLASGRRAVEFLHQHTGVEFFLPPYGPDYREGNGAATAGRALVIKEFDGRLLGSDFALLREPRPGFNVLGGMMVGRADLNALLAPLSSAAALRHACKILWRHAMDRVSWKRGTRLVMGNALVGRLLRDLRKHQVPVLLETRLVELVRNEGRVTAAVLRDGNGDRTVRPRVGVVLATGGFSSSAQWRSKFMPQGDLGMSVAAPGSTGDGLSIAVAANAALGDRDHRSNAFWMPTSVYRRPGKDTLLFPHIVLDRAKPGVIAVNAAGKRFVNEAGSYHDFVSAMLETPGMGPGKPAWLVCDASFVWRYGLGLVRPWQPSLRRFTKACYLLRGRTLQELAAQIGADAQALQQTVERHNRFAATGRDEEFGRGSTALNRQNGDPARLPNPCLAPIAKAPFYALAVWPADLGTSAGLKTDSDARVLDAEGCVIEGLYAVGNDMASIMQGSYPGPGTTLGPAIVFAYRAVASMLAAHAPGTAA